MSAKQLRKLRELREAGGTGEPEKARPEPAAKQPNKDRGAAPPRSVPAKEVPKEPQEEEEEVEEEEDEEEDGSAASQAESEKADVNPGFAALAGSSSSSSGSDAEVTPIQRPQASAPQAGLSVSAKKRNRKKKAGKAAEKEAEALAPADDDELGEDADWVTVPEAEANLEPERGPEAASYEDGVLAMRRADFSVETERRRATGGRNGYVGVGGADNASGPRGRRLAGRPRGGAQGRTVHHRRLFLVTPTAEEPWPKPDDCPEMVACTDDAGSASFDFVETQASTKVLDLLRRCLATQDPQLLQGFLQQNPFCVEGLLTMAEFLRTQQQAHEQAFQLSRRAAYAIECCFGPGFSPFQARATGSDNKRPAVVLRLPEDSPTWPGWSWLRTLWVYMHGLAGQGLHRTALENCKLLLASTLPRDPCRALFCFDYFCLRSRQYDCLIRTSRDLVLQYNLQGEDDGTLPFLDLAFPNFAYSLPLAGFLKGGSQQAATALREVSLDDVLPQNPADCHPAERPTADSAEGSQMHAQLMRALLLFPQALRPLLEEASARMSSPPGGSTSSLSWSDLLARPPFSDAADYRHVKHASAHDRICGAYAKRCGSLWKPDLALRWLHGCAARLAGMHESSVFAADLGARRRAWCETPLCLPDALRRDYPDLLPDEGMAVPKMPAVLENALQARLQPPPQLWRGQGDEDEDGQGGGGLPAWAAQGGLPPPTISLYSPPLLVFFQSLMPWAELDRSGVAVEPLCWRDVLRGSLNILQQTGLFLAGAMADLSRLAASLVQGAWQRPA